MQYLFSQPFKNKWKICEGIANKREQTPQTYKEFWKDLQKTQMGVCYNITCFISSSRSSNWSLWSICLTPLGDSFLPQPKHCSPSQWKILTLQSTIKGWRACTLKIPMLSFNKNSPCWKKAEPRCVHRLWHLRDCHHTSTNEVIGCSWVKYVQIPDILVVLLICCRNHTAEGSKGHYKRNLKRQWGGPRTFNLAQSPVKVSQQDHGAHEDVEELPDPSLLTSLVITKAAANFCQSLHWMKYGK